LDALYFLGCDPGYLGDYVVLYTRDATFGAERAPLLLPLAVSSLT
jgi:hypothetical protein